MFSDLTSDRLNKHVFTQPGSQAVTRAAFVKGLLSVRQRTKTVRKLTSSVVEDATEQDYGDSNTNRQRTA